MKNIKCIYQKQNPFNENKKKPIKLFIRFRTKTRKKNKKKLINFKNTLKKTKKKHLIKRNDQVDELE